MESVLEFKHISKYFPGVKALDDICFKAYGGEVLAFLGENGAGKSTLLKVLNGDYKPDAGEYLLNGEQKHFKSPQEAIEEGISVIYQERQILLELSVAENIYLGRMPSNRFGVINTAKGIMPQDLNIDSLLRRIDEQTEEVILATNPTVEGETTALYLSKLLEDQHVNVTRIAHGLPMGGHLDYADELTLQKAFEGRKKME